MICGEQAEYGGYLELGFGPAKPRYPGALALNTARNCLAYVLRARNIRTLHLPSYLCGAVKNTCAALGVQAVEYPIGRNFLPLPGLEPGPDEWVYLVNYYGQLGPEQAQTLSKRYGRRVIWDNVQAFFQPPCPGMDTIYTCRKFFGVPDGAYLFTDCRLEEPLERDESRERMAHLLGRADTGSANRFYGRYAENEERLETLPLRRMSRLTETLLGAIDCDWAARQRNENYARLARKLDGVNGLALHPPVGPYAYPLLLPKGEQVRRALQAQKVYVPLLWPEAAAAEHDPVGREYARNILPLPVDQRYGPEDMERMLAILTPLLG